jgi:hypothetical protein
MKDRKIEPNGSENVTRGRRTAPFVATAGIGTNSPFAALHKSGSYRGFTCRAFNVARRVSFDPQLPSPVSASSRGSNRQGALSKITC